MDVHTYYTTLYTTKDVQIVDIHGTFDIRCIYILNTLVNIHYVY